MAFKCLIGMCLFMYFTVFLRYHSVNGPFKPDEPLEIHHIQTLCANVLLHVRVYILKRSF